LSGPIYFEVWGEAVCRAEHARQLNPKEVSDMRAHRIVLSLIVLSFAISIVAQSPARSEEYRGTMEQQIACTPDVFRLCGEQIPDVNRIVACLRQNTPQLSGSCRAVFESNNSMPAEAAPKRRDSLSRSSGNQ
jgi:hypothetical protein